MGIEAGTPRFFSQFIIEQACQIQQQRVTKGGPVGKPGYCRIHPLVEERNNGVIPFNHLPDIKPYPVLLLQDK